MESFQPKRPNFLIRIVTSTFFQILMIFIFVFGAIFYIRHKQREELMNRVEFLKGGPLIVEKTAAPAEAVVETKKEEIAPTANAAPAQALSVATATPSSAAEALPTTNTERTSSKTAQQIKMRLIYAEVDRATMEAFRQDALIAGQYTDFGDFKAGAIPANKKISRERGVRILHREEKELTAGPTMNWFTGMTTSNGEPHLGISGMTSIEISQKNIIKGEIEVHRLFHESLDSNEPAVNRPYPATTFELNPGMTWMMSLSLPAFPQEEPGKSEPQGIMRIFNSPQFKNNSTEFTLFIEFDTSSAK